MYVYYTKHEINGFQLYLTIYFLLGWTWHHTFIKWPCEQLVKSGCKDALENSCLFCIGISTQITHICLMWWH